MFALPIRTRVAENISNSFKADRTACACASRIRASSPTNAAIETDLGGEKVKS
jgi:hypothetical protein